MRSHSSLLLLSIFIARILSAQSPFQFREACLLEMRMGRSGIELNENSGAVPEDFELAGAGHL